MVVGWGGWRGGRMADVIVMYGALSTESCWKLRRYANGIGLLFESVVVVNS